MAENLEYAPPLPWHRRRWRMAVVIALILAGAYVPAVPRIRAFKERLERRAEIRKQFWLELANARRSLDQGKLDDASSSLLCAEYPVHAVATLFRASEVEQFKLQLTPMRDELRARLALRREEEDERQAIADAVANAKRREQDARDARSGVTRLRCGIDWSYARAMRDQTRDKLKIAAAAALVNRNYTGFRGRCGQIVDLTPYWVLDDRFWK